MEAQLSLFHQYKPHKINHSKETSLHNRTLFKSFTDYLLYPHRFLCIHLKVPVKSVIPTKVLALDARR